MNSSSTPIPSTWIDGRIVPSDHPAVSALDHGLLLGDGVFDALVVRDRRPLMIDRHLRRLRRGLDRLGIDGAPADVEILDAIAELLTVSGLTDARIRITVTPGAGLTSRQRGPRPTTLVTIDRLAPAPATTTLTVVPWARNDRSPLAGIKSTSWAENAFALRHARSLGFDNALFLDTSDRLSECATANIFLVHGESILTPSLDAGCLAGTVREALVEHGVAIERDLWVDDIDRSQAAFITTSTTGIVPVVRIDDREFPDDAPAIERARAALLEE